MCSGKSLYYLLPIPFLPPPRGGLDRAIDSTTPPGGMYEAVKQGLVRTLAWPARSLLDRYTPVAKQIM